MLTLCMCEIDTYVPLVIQRCRFPDSNQWNKTICKPYYLIRTKGGRNNSLTWYLSAEGNSRLTAKRIYRHSLLTARIYWSNHCEVREIEVYIYI